MPARITDKGNGKYLLCVSNGYDGNGKQIVCSRTVSATSKRAAEKEYAKFVTEIENGETGSSMKLHDFFPYYLKNHTKVISRSYDRLQSFYTALFIRIDNVLGNKKLYEITPVDINHFIETLKNDKDTHKFKDGKERKLSTSFIANHYNLLSSMLNMAVRWKMIKDNPCVRIDVPKIKHREKKILDIDTCKRFLSLLGKEPLKYQVAVYICLCGGLRKGELYALQFKDVSEDSIYIGKDSVYTGKEHGVKIQEGTKNGKCRIVSLPPFVMQLIQKRKEEVITYINLLDNHWNSSKDIDENYLMVNDEGKITTSSNFNSWLRQYNKRYGFPSITPHSFRHMTATFLIAAGVDIQTVAGKLGHASTLVTQKVYSHLLLKKETETANVISNLLEI